jgi:hypothetical protein
LIAQDALTETERLDGTADGAFPERSDGHDVAGIDAVHHALVEAQI